MGQHKITSHKVRSLMAASELQRQRRIQDSRSVSRMRVMPSKPRLSTRGEPGETWRTKAWTPARLLSREWDLQRARERAEKDRAAKAVDKAEHIARQGDDPHPQSAPQRQNLFVRSWP